MQLGRQDIRESWAQPHTCTQASGAERSACREGKGPPDRPARAAPGHPGRELWPVAAPTCVPRRRLDDGVPRLQGPLALSILNHSQADAVLHAPARVEELTLGHWSQRRIMREEEDPDR